MKNITISLFYCITFIVFLVYPGFVLEGAQNGLLLWFHTVLPTLFPFMVLTTILANSNAVHFISKLCSPVLCPLFRVSPNGCFAVIGGFLCGYPMGAKIISDLYETNKISKSEASYLLSFCNNVSPAFILSFIVVKTLELRNFMLPTISILLCSPLLASFLFRRIYRTPNDTETTTASTTLSILPLWDMAITNGMQNMVKIGGYIIFFSVLSTVLKMISYNNIVIEYFLLPSIEITNGITMINHFSLSLPYKYLLIMVHTSFGGICSIFQTKCVLKDMDVSLGVYTIEKLVTALVTSFLTIIYLQIYML